MTGPLPALALALMVSQALLGTPLRLESFSLRPPEGFRMVRMAPFQDTRVGAVGGVPGGERSLLAALVDGDDDDASTLLIAKVEGTFTVVPSARDDFATAAVRHFADELGLTLMMERAERVDARRRASRCWLRSVRRARFGNPPRGHGGRRPPRGALVQHPYRPIPGEVPQASGLARFLSKRHRSHSEPPARACRCRRRRNGRRAPGLLRALAAAACLPCARLGMHAP